MSPKYFNLSVGAFLTCVALALDSRGHEVTANILLVVAILNFGVGIAFALRGKN